MMSYQVCKRDIEKHSTSNGKDSIWSKTTAQQDPQCKTEITGHRWQQIKTRSLTNTHAWVQQNHKITCRETERKSDIKKWYDLLMMGLYVCVLPSSWGNSSQKMAIEVLKPVSRDSVKDAPMARPSMKLCTASLTVIIHATVFILDVPSPFSQRQVNNTHAFCTNLTENRHC